MSVLDKLKKGVSSTAKKAAVETAYLTAKTSNKFPHSEQLAQYLAILNRIRSQLTLKEKIGQMGDKNRELLSLQDRMGLEFQTQTTDASVNQEEKELIFKLFAQATALDVTKHQSLVQPLE